MPAPTVVVAVPWLLPGSESGVLEVAVATLTRLPTEVVTVATIVTVALPPGVIEPRLAVTVPLVPTAGPAQVPVLGVQEANVVPAGSGSLSTTASAVAGPRFDTMMS
jgi:hypothetical protein